MVNKNLYDFLIDTLENKREILIDILLSRKEIAIQENLFESETDSLNIILEDLLYLIKQEKPLYQRWNQKINDKERQLSVPNKPLKKFIEDYILDFIKNKNVHKNCHGGELGWSVKSSLETHLPCESVLSFDLEKAFENIPNKAVFDFFYELLGSSLSYQEKENMASFLSILCTLDYKNKRGLPQGSPCSMALFNRILFSLDKDLYQKSKERGFKYTRWVDDLTISSPNNDGIESLLGAIELTEEYFPISKEKIFFQNSDKIYLLGHKIIDGRILEKNTKEEKLTNKNSPINFYEWFNNGIKNYDSWN